MTAWLVKGSISTRLTILNTVFTKIIEHVKSSMLCVSELIIWENINLFTVFRNLSDVNKPDSGLSFINMMQSVDLKYIKPSDLSAVMGDIWTGCPGKNLSLRTKIIYITSVSLLLSSQNIWWLFKTTVLPGGHQRWAGHFWSAWGLCSSSATTGCPAAWRRQAPAEERKIIDLTADLRRVNVSKIRD